MILGRILASKSSKDEDDDEADHEDYDNDCWFKFYPKRDKVEVQKWRILRSKNGWILRSKNGSRMDGFGIQKWMDFGGAKFPILEGCPWK